MSARDISDFKTFVSICEYGRAAKAASCARRSLAAETTFIALVICRVFTTLRIRRRMSRMLGIVVETQLVTSHPHRVLHARRSKLRLYALFRYRFPRCHELLLRLLDHIG